MTTHANQTTVDDRSFACYSKNMVKNRWICMHGCPPVAGFSHTPKLEPPARSRSSSGPDGSSTESPNENCRLSCVSHQWPCMYCTALKLMARWWLVCRLDTHTLYIQNSGAISSIHSFVHPASSPGHQLSPGELRIISIYRAASSKLA